MDAVFMFESMGKGDQNRRLIFALAAPIGALEDRINYLEQSTSKGKKR
jgi:hypothetical protein